MHASEQMYALSRSSTKSSVDAGIPQAEARGKGGYARVVAIRIPQVAYTRALARLPENNR